MDDQQKQDPSSVGDPSQTKSANPSTPKTVKIHPTGPNTYRADPNSERQFRRKDVIFDNKSKDDVRLEFFKDGTNNTPFGGSQPYLVKGGGTLPLTVRKDADTGKHEYLITKAALPGGPPTDGGIPDESPAQSEVGQKHSGEALARAAAAGPGGSNPEMIID